MSKCESCKEDVATHDVVTRCSSGHPVELRCPGGEATIKVFCECDPVCESCEQGMADHEVVARCAAGHPVEVRCPGGSATQKVACACD